MRSWRCAAEKHGTAHPESVVMVEANGRHYCHKLCTTGVDKKHFVAEFSGCITCSLSCAKLIDWHPLKPAHVSQAVTVWLLVAGARGCAAIHGVPPDGAGRGARHGGRRSPLRHSPAGHDSVALRGAVKATVLPSTAT